MVNLYDKQLPFNEQYKVKSCSSTNMTHTLSLPICIHSSLVGVIIRAMGPSVSSRGGWSTTCRNIGRRKANVFPEPVLAIPMTSLPFIMAGMAWFWKKEWSSISKFTFIYNNRVFMKNFIKYHINWNCVSDLHLYGCWLFIVVLFQDLQYSFTDSTLSPSLDRFRATLSFNLDSLKFSSATIKQTPHTTFTIMSTKIRIKIMVDFTLKENNLVYKNEKLCKI